ncbi:MAG: 4'-phosphopantetheinyl transferase superfamily protein [Pseudomonadota bacterium]
MQVRLIDGRTISDAQVDALLAWLGPGEMARYQRFVRRERKRQFVIGRVLARQMLGPLLGVAPRTLQIDDRIGQAPQLTGHAAAFSISHSGPWVACAVSACGALGLDIELRDPARDIDALAAQSFDAATCAWLAARPAHTRLHDFYVLWSTHEAHIKLGVDPVMTIELAHPELSVVLCSSIPFDSSIHLTVLTI